MKKITQGRKRITKKNEMKMGHLYKDNDSAQPKVNKIIQTPKAMALLKGYNQKMM